MNELTIEMLDDMDKYLKAGPIFELSVDRDTLGNLLAAARKWVEHKPKCDVVVNQLAALEAELKAAYDHAATMEAESATLVERLTKLVEELKTIAAKPAPGGEGEK